MLRDFLLLELYFSRTEAAQSIEDAAKRYGRAAVVSALRNGLLTGRCVPSARRCESGGGRFLCWLSEKGRVQARLR